VPERRRACLTDRALPPAIIDKAAPDPPPPIWDRVRAALVASLPAAEPSRVAHAPALATGERAAMADLSQRRRRWRGATGAVTAIAATFAGTVVIRELRPEILPEQLRPKAQVVEVTKTVLVPSPKPAQYGAVLQRDAATAHRAAGLCGHSRREAAFIGWRRLAASYRR
jgi:DNA-binding transcriptional regulator YdaS (Cro superfamily)